MTSIDLQLAFEILDRAYLDHNPVRIVPLISGGDDSKAMLSVFWEWSRARRIGNARATDVHVAHIDTGTGIPETLEHVWEWSLREEFYLNIYHTPRGVYENMVLGLKVGIPGGFPGPGMHHIYYSRLKDRRIDTILAYGKEDRRAKRTDRVMFVSGIRKSESTRRMGYDDPISVRGSQVWVNPLFYWDKELIWDRIEGQPRNPASERMHISGECLCGCYARPDELDELRFWFPHVGRRIDDLVEQVRAQGFDWGYGEFKRAPSLPRPEGTFMPLCASCQLELPL